MTDQSRNLAKGANIVWLFEESSRLTSSATAAVTERYKPNA